MTKYLIVHRQSRKTYHPVPVEADIMFGSMTEAQIYLADLDFHVAADLDVELVERGEPA